MSTRAIKAAGRECRAWPQPATVQLRILPRHPLQLRVDESPRQKRQSLQLARFRSGPNDIVPMPVQRKKDEQDRGDKQRRRQHATETIGKLGGSLSAGLYDHIFNALPIGGGALDPAHPSGLHGYTAGALPDTVAVVARRGSAAGIHALTWRAAAGTVNKTSTMFPSWMPPPHVATLIALKYPDVRQDAVEEPLYSEDTKTYIQHGQDIYSRIRKSGDTVYPQ